MGEIRIGSDVTTDETLTCDVCIVGSGAGGAVLGAGLAEQGLDVLILEEGGYFTNADFDLQEANAFPMLYQERGTRGTADKAITILQGRTVGGSTTVNWTTCYRTPKRILDHWAEVHGTELDESVLTPHWEAVEERLNIHRWPEAAINANNRALRDGCRALGWEYNVLRRNVKGCANSGYCGVGCPVDGKQGMHLTYIPDGLEAGMRVLADCRVETLEVDGDRVVAAHGVIMERDRDVPVGTRVTVKAKLFVSAAGAVNGPALFLRSGLNDNGRVGLRTFLHPVVGVAGVYDSAVDPWFGAPQSIGSHQFIDRGSDKMGFFMEAPPLQPMLASTAFKVHGHDLTEAMGLLKYTSSTIALNVDGLLPGDDGGTVSLRSDGKLQVDYPFRPHLIESFRAAYNAMIRVQLAGGAREVVPLIIGAPRITDPAEIDAVIAEADLAPLRHAVFTAHQMGGLAMGADPAASVVNPQLRHHRVENLYVVDGSVLPTALGVNPSETIYGIAHWARDHIAEAV